MNHKINLQARIKRHSRILKDNLWNTLHNSKKKNFWYWMVALLLIMFPVYPAFSNTELQFDRSEIDESSILSFYDENPLMNIEAETTFETKDWFLSIGSFVEETETKKDIKVVHKIEKGDTLALIAKKYDISEDTIKWATGIKTDKDLKIDSKISFPSCSWIFYTIKKGDTISWISAKYKIKSSEIFQKNNLVKNIIKPWQEILIPGWKYIKEEIKKKIIEKKVYAKKTYNKKPNNKKVKKSYVSSLKNVKWRYPLKWHRPKSWAAWNCTWYVASYKAVDWRWNANQWLRNARAKWHKTGSYAKNWAIIVLWGRWYNRRYGHVAIVREVHKNHLIISDMNYRSLYQVTVRKIKRYWSHVRWYIYVK